MTLPAMGAAPPGQATGPIHVFGHRQMRMLRSIYPPYSLSSLCISFLLLLFAHVKKASAQLDPINNFCRRFGHQTAIIDRRLYVDGGLVNYSPFAQYPNNYTNDGLLYHDLDRPGDGMPQLYANLTKDISIPRVHGGTLWADNINKRFYLFGGEYYQRPPPQQFNLWSYDVINSEWFSFGPPKQVRIDPVSYGAGVAIAERGEGYYFGGLISNNSAWGWAGPPVAVPGIVKYIMDSNVWKNDTGPDSIGRAEGAMVFIPISDAGMLVYFGGVQDPQLNGTFIGQPMDQILLYDVSSSKWYKQNATGTVPQMRRRFCAGAAWAPDQSSYNIYVYGGAGLPPDTAGFDDLYILTIPSFQWIKVEWAKPNGDYPHHSLTCDVVDHAQMLILGGTFPVTNNCDVPNQYGLHGLDMGAQLSPEKDFWRFYSPNLTTYAVPDPIIKVVGGSAGGGATKTAPDGGFHDGDLRLLMTRAAKIPTRTPTRPIPKSTGESDETKIPTGAIAGIAIAATIVFLAGLIGSCWFIKRHRRNQKPKTSAPTPRPGYPIQDTDNTGIMHTPHTSSPFTSQEPPHQCPVELPVASEALPFAPPAQPHTYEMVYTPPPASAHPLPCSNPSAANLVNSDNSMKGTPTAAGTGNSAEPRTMIDEEGRMWVQVSPPLPAAVRQRTGSSPVAGGHSPGAGTDLGLYPTNGTGWLVSPNTPREPQELGVSQPRPRGTMEMGEVGGSDAVDGRPRHTTFYHP